MSLYVTFGKCFTAALRCFMVSRSMSGHHLAKYGHQRSLSRGHSKDFTVATPEEFVKRFGGDRVINKVPATLSKVQYVFCQSRCLSVWHLYIVTIALSCIISHIQPDIGRKSQNLYTPPVFGILRRCLQWWGYHMREKVWWYVKLFQYNMGAWQTDRRTELLYRVNIEH